MSRFLSPVSLVKARAKENRMRHFMCKFSHCFPFANCEASEEYREQVFSCNGRGERATWKPNGTGRVKQGPEGTAEDGRHANSGRAKNGDVAFPANPRFPNGPAAMSASTSEIRDLLDS
ncbi:hypothetical protein U0070_006788 [Myodes glareolus]|uniref:Uncharacterized protein n=1 Tax=Myodes glareolus TaxID=447135 RepID=A0AAW0HZ31_MYOGA